MRYPFRLPSADGCIQNSSEAAVVGSEMPLQCLFVSIIDSLVDLCGLQEFPTLGPLGGRGCCHGLIVVWVLNMCFKVGLSMTFLTVCLDRNPDNRPQVRRATGRLA